MNRDSMKVSRREALLAGAGLAGTLAALTDVPLPVHAQTAGQTTGPIAPGGTLPVAQMEAIMQTTGTVMNGVLNIAIDRNDLSVTGPNGHPFKPSMDPVDLFFFQSLANGQAFMNAEFTFTQAEMTPVLDAVFANGLTIMAEHQHFIGETPQLWHYHFRGMGDPLQLAQAAINVVKVTSAPLPQIKPANPTTPLPADQLASILKGTPVVGADGAVTVMVLRNDTFVEAGVTLLPQTNVLHKIVFEALDNTGQTALCGPDYALISSEVQPVLMAGRSLGFEVHCLYNQQTDEQPQLYFSHQLASGNPLDLATRVRQALDKTDSAGSPATAGTPAGTTGATVTGSIITVSADTITIGANGSTTAIALSPVTQYYFRSGLLLPPVVLNPGLTVKIDTVTRADGSVLAQTVYINP